MFAYVTRYRAYASYRNTGEIFDRIREGINLLIGALIGAFRINSTTNGMSATLCGVLVRLQEDLLRRLVSDNFGLNGESIGAINGFTTNGNSFREVNYRSVKATCYGELEYGIGIEGNDSSVSFGLFNYGFPGLSVILRSRVLLGIENGCIAYRASKLINSSASG